MTTSERECFRLRRELQRPRCECPGPLPLTRQLAREALLGAKIDVSHFVLSRVTSVRSWCLGDALASDRVGSLTRRGAAH